MPAPAPPVLISFRQDRGSAEAMLIETLLSASGMPAQLRSDELFSIDVGDDLQAYYVPPPRVRDSGALVLVCSPGCIARCRNPRDRIRLEVAEALRLKRKIVTVTLPGFRWSAEGAIPAELAELRNQPDFMFIPSGWRSSRRNLLTLLGGAAAPSLWAPRTGDDSGKKPRRKAGGAASIEAPPKVLLLHGEADYRASLNMCGVIEESGLGCRWPVLRVARRGMASSMRDMVKESSLVAVLVSKSMVASENLAPVLQLAKRLGRPVVLVRSAGCRATLPKHLREWHTEKRMLDFPRDVDRLGSELWALIEPSAADGD